MGRFWVEMFRPDAWRMGTLATAQWIAIIAFVVGLGAIIINHVRPELEEAGKIEPCKRGPKIPAAAAAAGDGSQPAE